MAESTPKTLQPGFPHMEVLIRMTRAMFANTDDVRDLLPLAVTLGVYAARVMANAQGRTLDPEEWTRACLLAYQKSDDESARVCLAQAQDGRH
jgi:hypothetical protein